MHFGVELNGIEIPRGISRDGKGRVGRGAVHLKARRDFRHMVAVAHPDLLIARFKPTCQKGAAFSGFRDIGLAKLGRAMPAFDVAAKAMHHDLLAIADAKDRHAQIKHALGRHRRAVPINRGRTARENHGPRPKGPQEGVIHFVIGMNFAIDVQFPQAARDQLRYLRAEVDDEKAIMLGHGFV